MSAPSGVSPWFCRAAEFFFLQDFQSYIYNFITPNCLSRQLSVSSSPSQQLFAVNQTAAAASSDVLLNPCNEAHGTQILCKLEHEVAGDTTFSCKEHNLQMHELYIEFHGGKVP